MRSIEVRMCREIEPLHGRADCGHAMFGMMSVVIASEFLFVRSVVAALLVLALVVLAARNGEDPVSGEGV